MALAFFLLYPYILRSTSWKIIIPYAVIIIKTHSFPGIVQIGAGRIELTDNPLIRRIFYHWITLPYGGLPFFTCSMNPLSARFCWSEVLRFRSSYIIMHYPLRLSPLSRLYAGYSTLFPLKNVRLHGYVHSPCLQGTYNDINSESRESNPNSTHSVSTPK